MATYTLDWSETDLGGTAVTSYGSGAILDFTDKPSGATSALSITSHQSDGVDNIMAEFSIQTSGSSVMTFAYKVSTESGWDKFHIDVDGVSQANYSGIVAWTTHAGISIPSAGVHTIRFRYTKDGGGAVNADRVWVALLNITNTVTVNDSSASVDTYDMEDGAIPAEVTTSTWTNSTSEPIAGSRSLRSPASPANGGTYDLEITKPAGSDWAAVGFDFKTSTESGWDKLFLFPDAGASNIPGTGSPSTSGEAGWLEWSGSTSGRIAVVLPAAESSLLLRYTKDGGGAGGSDAVWIDNLDMPAAGGGAIDLTPADSAHGHTSESPAVTQVHAVAPTDTANAHTADSPPLTQAHAVTPADSAHGHTTDAPTLTQTHAVTPADTAHTHATDQPALTQTHTIAPADSSHQHSAESPTVTQAGDLAPADTAHAHTSDTPTVTQVHVVTPADSSHSHASESPTITQGLTIQPDDSIHGHASDTPALTQVHELAPADTVNAHTTETPTVTQVHALAPVDTVHSHTADSPLVSIPSGLPPPASRTVTTPAEDRILRVAAETRIVTTPAENRTITD